MSSKRLPPSLEDHLTRSPQLAYYFQRANAQPASSFCLQEQLPEALRHHVSAVVDAHRLTLFASNNAVAQLLRFHAPHLQRAAGVEQVKITIAPPPSIATQTPAYQRHLPIEAAKLLESLAATVNSPLREALLRLASQAEGK